MNEQEREMDLALAECEAENRLLRARNERLQQELAIFKQIIDAQTISSYPLGYHFCPRCGKRTSDLASVHTCTPPKENT